MIKILDKVAKPLVLLLLDGNKEVVQELVPQPGLVQVGGVTSPRQLLGLSGAGEQSQVIPGPEHDQR